jgi:hypothetical protein
MRVTCPCCHGEKRHLVHEDVDGVVIVSVMSCCHCQETGTVEAEVAESWASVTEEAAARLVPRYDEE